MALRINTHIQNDVDGYLLDARNVKGGYVVVSGVGQDLKENLPVKTKVEGTLVYDAAEKKSYRWSGTAWVEDSSAAGDIESQVKSLLAAGVELIRGDEVYSGDFYFDKDSIYSKDDVTGEYEPVISNVLNDEEKGTTDGHVFNDTLNTAYIAGNTTNPKYITEGADGNAVISDIALKSDIPDVSEFITKDADNLTNYTKTEDLAKVATSGSYNDLEDKPDIPVVVANPAVEATETLKKLTVDDKTYELEGNGATENTFTFENDLVTMYNIGKVTATEDSPTTIEAKGKTFKEVWNEMFVNIVNPAVAQPSWSATYSESDVLGAYITPTVTLTFNPGSYSYGPNPTGVTVTALEVNDEAKVLTNNTVTVQLEETVVESTVSTSISYSYSGAENPVDNVGNEVPSLKIQDKADATESFTHKFAKTGTLAVLTPTVSASVSSVSAYEAGTVVRPTYTISLANPAGYYPYGSVEYSGDKSAGVESKLTKSINGGASESAETGTFGFGDITITDSAQTQTIAAAVEYGDSERIPLSPKGNRVPGSKIAAGKSTSSKTCSIPAGYRKIFWGYSTTADLNSNVIRALTKYKKNAALTEELLNEDTTAVCIVIAAPAGTRTLSKVTMPSSSEADVTTQFVKQSATIDVEGTNGYTAIAYDVWLYQPAEMAGTYKITMK